MTRKLDQQTAEYHAQEVLSDSELSSLPIDPFEIARQQEIECQEMTVSNGISGVLMRIGDSFTIGYNTCVQNRGFNHFTIAHELGHYFLPDHPDKLFPFGDGKHESQAGFSSNDEWEKQADFFASALLMPSDLFQEALLEAEEGLPAVEYMARLCQTSLTATAIRYAAVTDCSCVVILSDGKKILYSGSSEPIQNIVPKSNLWLRDSIVPPRSYTADYGKKASLIKTNERKEGYCLLSDWIDDAPDIEMKEDAVGLGSYGRVLTLLFSEDMELDEDDDY